MVHGKRLDVLDSGRDEFGARERAGSRPMAGPAGHARRCAGRSRERLPMRAEVVQPMNLEGARALREKVRLHHLAT